MHDPTYRQALSASWKFAWRHKLLWPFGLFAAFLGQMGLWEFMTSVGLASNRVSSLPIWIGFYRLFREIFSSAFWKLDADTAVWMVWLVVLFLGIILVMTFIAVVSQGVLIEAAARGVKGRALPDVHKAWHVSVKYFWHVFAINIGKKVILSLLSLSMAWGIASLFVYQGSFQALLGGGAFVSAILLGVIVSFLTMYAVGYVIIERYQFREAIQSAWQLFMKHWLVSFEVGVIIFFFNILFSLVALAALILFFFPTMILWFIAIVVGNATLFILGGVIGLLLFVVFVMIVGSFFQVFTTTVWMYLFMHMHRLGLKSRMMHVLRHRERKRASG